MHIHLSARSRLIRLPAAMATAVLLLLVAPGAIGAANAQGGFYRQRNLVSDLPNIAKFQDPNLVNAWGLSHSPNGPWQVSDNGTGLSTQYKGNGMSVPPVVTIPPPAGSPAGTTAAPTGNVFNSTSDFVVSKGSASGPSQFLFATEDGTISGWNPSVDSTHAILVVDRSTVRQGKFVGAVYKGLALGSNSSGAFLFATDFRFGAVEMFDAQFQLVKSFTDTQLSSDCPLHGQCFAPFGIQNIGGALYVTFALQNAAHHDDMAGPGNGFVDVFDTSGNLLRRFASHGTLNSPWGLALAPAGFGPFSNDVLVGNFGDGRINAFSPGSGAFLGQLQDASGHAIAINGLWGLAFGNGGLAGATTTLFFASGLNDEADGLFGSIEPA
jgi:uncharacterized protein (TIGR03118 family)